MIYYLPKNITPVINSVCNDLTSPVKKQCNSILGFARTGEPARRDRKSSYIFGGKVWNMHFIHI